MRSLLPLALLATPALAQRSECVNGIYMIVARGTNETAGPGITGKLAKEIVDRVDGSIIVPLDYPATFTDPDYWDSESAGVDELQEVITSYHTACPKGKIAVFGYSQGGQIASDAFCGGTGSPFSDSDPLPIELVDESVVAIIIFGDPSHVASASYNQGTSSNDGIFARDNITLCEDNYSDILRSYCDTGDTYCDQGEVRAVHGSYVEKYGDKVVDFVINQFESAVSGSSSVTGSATTTVTTVSTASVTATTTEAEETGASEETGTATTAESETATSTSTESASTVTENAASGLAPGLLAAAGLPLAFAMFEMMI